MTTFNFLRRIGLESKAFGLEDAGFAYWVEWKHLNKDEIKEKSGMSDTEAAFCHSVLTGDAQRPDLLRKFQLPEFEDILQLFCVRFPDARAWEARDFAMQLTDELGTADFSCFQIQQYLKEASTPQQAREGLHKQDSQLLCIADAEAARQRPPQPPPPEEPKDWVHSWMKDLGLEEHSQSFIQQALTSREDVLGAPLDHGTLEKLGVTKLGHRCKILRAVGTLKADGC
jgi:hypothetical protein